MSACIILDRYTAVKLEETKTWISEKLFKYEKIGGENSLRKSEIISYIDFVPGKYFYETYFSWKFQIYNITKCNLVGQRRSAIVYAV